MQDFLFTQGFLMNLDLDTRLSSTLFLSTSRDTEVVDFPKHSAISLSVAPSLIFSSICVRSGEVNLKYLPKLPKPNAVFLTFEYFVQLNAVLLVGRSKVSQMTLYFIVLSAVLPTIFHNQGKLAHTFFIGFTKT